MMVGIPCVGKTTWIKNNIPNITLISNDAFIEQYAKLEGLTYNQSFDRYASKALKAAKDLAIRLSNSEEDCVQDNTNVSIKSRAKTLPLFSHYDEIIAVTFNITIPEHKRRIAQRRDKIIPPEVVESMSGRYQSPTKAEGFTRIIKVIV